MPGGWKPWIPILMSFAVAHCSTQETVARGASADTGTESWAGTGGDGDGGWLPADATLLDLPPAEIGPDVAGCFAPDAGSVAPACNCPTSRFLDPFTPCDLTTDCASCGYGTCWFECLACPPLDHTAWVLGCTE